MLLIIDYRLGHPEGSVEEKQDRDNNEGWMLHHRLPMLLEHDEHDHED